MARWRQGHERRTGRKITEADLALAKGARAFHDVLARHASELAFVVGAGALPRRLRLRATASPKFMDDSRAFLRKSPAARTAAIEAMREDALEILKVCRALLNADAAGRRAAAGDLRPEPPPLSHEVIR